MGLFGKKKKKEDMDVPPPPPPEEGEEAKPEAIKEAPEEKEELPELPKIEVETHLPSELPEIKPEGEKEEKPSMPEFPSAPEKEEAEEAPEEPEKPKEEPEISVVQPEKGPKFMPVTKFQTVLTEAEEIKSSIKETEEIIVRVKKLREEEEKTFDKWRAHLEGVEKKLNYIDSMIFKGE